MSTQEEKEIIEKWQERFENIAKYNDLGALQYIAYDVRHDAEKCPKVARQLVNMTINAINTPEAKNKVVYHDYERSLADSMLDSNTRGILEMGELDSRIFTDFLDFKLKNNYDFGISMDSVEEFLLPAIEEGKLSAKLLYDSTKQSMKMPASSLSNDDYDIKSYYRNKYYRNKCYILSECVAADSSLAKDFIKIAKELNRKDVDTTKLAYLKLSENLDKLPPDMATLLADNIEKRESYYDPKDAKAMFNIVRHDKKYLPQYQKMFYSPQTENDAIFVAKIYEDLQQKSQDNVSVEDYAKNRSTKTLTPEEGKMAKACEALLQEYKYRDALKVKIAKNYPSSAEKLDTNNENYIEMCVNNLEHPEKENIRSILNRLESVDAKTTEDFVAAVDFVHRRDMCKKICRDFDNAKNEEYHKEHDSDVHLLTIDVGQLSYGMAEAGIKDKETAEKVVDLFYHMNVRPDTYNSSYNNFYPENLKNMTDLEEWMYPVIVRAVRDGVVSPSRLGGGKDLFAACKAWRINSKMPKAIAEQVGEMSLAKRMVAGAIVDDMARAQIQAIKKDASKEELINRAAYRDDDTSFFASVEAGVNYNKELIPEFWKEMSKAQEMSFAEAMKTYVPDTSINRKRFVAAMLEEMGVENTDDKYQQTYKNLEENGKFEEFLASDSKDLKLEKIKQNKAKVQENSAKKKSIRERLAERGILPEAGKHGEGHQIKVPSKDMSQFKEFVDGKTR